MAEAGHDAVRRALDEAGHHHVPILERLEGGASTREFFRVVFEGWPAIAMYTPAPSQEIEKARQTGGYASFVEVASLLSASGIPVPRIMAASSCAPVLFVEDLGNDTLANYLLRCPLAKESLYQQAVSILAHAQSRLDPIPHGCVIAKRAFDYDLLRWEVEHFVDWALVERGFALSDTERAVFDRCAHFLAQTISSWPRGFVHRDYQSRNIMVRGDLGSERLTWIDFQDAMLGPRVYDLVALLTDSYQSFSVDFVERRLDEYCDIVGIAEERAQLGLEFGLVTVQRKLKDAGRFVFLDRVNNNSRFLQFVEPTIEKVRRALDDVAHIGPLDELRTLLDERLGPAGAADR